MNNWQGMVELVMVVGYCTMRIVIFFFGYLMHGCLVFYSLEIFFRFVST